MEDQATVIPPTPVEPSPRRRHSLPWSQLPLILALIIIGGLLVVWKPWEAGADASDRTITVTGTAEVTAEPDEYVFTPRYEFKNADRKAAQAEATAKTNEIVSELKKLGVPDRKIKTDASNYDYSFYPDSADKTTYTASITVTVDDKDLAQKVQDYLLTTTPQGEVTPSADFSKAKRQQLTNEGRDQATKDARAKADQSAKNLGFKIGKVKAVKDQSDNYFDIYGARDSVMSAAGGASAESAPIQQGENDLSYQVTVTYYVR